MCPVMGFILYYRRMRIGNILNNTIGSSGRESEGALEGIRVVDCSQILAGPFCSMLLGDMGADIIKVEKPSIGDDMRRWGPPFLAGESASFLAINRNKSSIVANIKTKEGAAVVKRLVEGADVFIENYRHGAMERAGLGYEEMAKLNPRLIYCSISGFGRTGPKRKDPCFDLIAQGLSGLMSITGSPDGPPLRTGVPIADLNTGLFAAFGIVSALVARERIGKGQYIDVSLVDSGIAYTVWESARYFTTGEVPGRLGSAHRLSAPYQAFKCSDGYINIAAPNQTIWENLCNALKREDLIQDVRFIDNRARMANREALEMELEKILIEGTREYWLETLNKTGVPAGPIMNMAEVWESEQVQAREMVVEQEHRTAGKVRTIGSPVKMSETPCRLRNAAPLLGEHTKDILQKEGYSEAEIERMTEDGTIQQ